MEKTGGERNISKNSIFIDSSLIYLLFKIDIINITKSIIINVKSTLIVTSIISPPYEL